MFEMFKKLPLMLVVMLLASATHIMQAQQNAEQPAIAEGGQSVGGAGLTQSANPGEPCDQIPKADLCRLAPQAQAGFEALSQQVANDRQIIKNFGFEKTTEDIESWAQFGEEARNEYERIAKKALWDAAFEGVKLALRPGFSPSPVRAQELSDRLTSLLQKARVPQSDELYNLARHAGQEMSVQEAERLTAGLDRLEHAFDLGKAGYEANTGEILQSVLSVASMFHSGIGLLALDLNTLSLAVYGTEYKVAEHHIEKLTTLAEGDLELLKKYTEQLKKDVSDLRRVNCILKAASTQNCSLNVEDGHKHDGKHTGRILAVTSGAVGAGLGTAFLLKNLHPGGSCISTRNCIVSVLGGSCDCSQSTADGPCNFSGSVAQAGQSCGAGVPCASGLSCNNGVCEGPNGRCPF